MKTSPANPRRSLFGNCFKSWFDAARWWGMSCAFYFLRNYWFRCFLRRVMVIFVSKRILVPMSYISFWEWQKVVPQGPFGWIKLYFEPEKRPAGDFFWGGLYSEPESHPNICNLEAEVGKAAERGRQPIWYGGGREPQETYIPEWGDSGGLPTGRRIYQSMPF